MRRHQLAGDKMSPVERREVRIDGATGLLLFAGVLLYLNALPRNLNEADEAYFLYEAKRILQGEVLYRDVFWFALPAAHWSIAFAYAVFGVSMDVARIAMAVLHGFVAIGLFAVCRRLGVRREIAAIPPIAHIALCQSAWPFASPHWFSTLFMVLLLFVALGRSWERRPREALFLGLLTAGLISVHQQKGAAFAVAIAALFFLDHLLRLRFGEEDTRRALARRLLFYVGGLAIIVVPLLCALATFAGVHTFVDQVFIHPLTGYRSHNSSPWAGVNLMTARYARYTAVPILKNLPLVLAVGIVRLGLNARLRRDRDTSANLLTLLVFCGAGVLAISYLPDFIHVSFIAPLFLAVWAETLEVALRWVGRVLPRPIIWGRLVAASLVAALVMRLEGNLAWAHQEYPFSYPTAFGRIDFSNDKPVYLIEEVMAALRDYRSRGLFVYPIYASLYLMTDTNNPARHQFLLPGFHSEQHFADTLRRIDASQVAHIVACDLPMAPGDPIRSYIQEHYDPIASGAGPADGFIQCTLYRRRAEVQTGGPPPAAETAYLRPSAIAAGDVR